MSRHALPALLLALLLCLGGCTPAGEESSQPEAEIGRSAPEPALPERPLPESQTEPPPKESSSAPETVSQAGFDFSPEVRRTIAQGFLDCWENWDPALCPDLLIERLPRVRINTNGQRPDYGLTPRLEVPDALSGAAYYPPETALINHGRMEEFFTNLENGTHDEIAVLTRGDPIPMIFRIYTFDGQQLWNTVIYTGPTDPDCTDFLILEPPSEPSSIKAVGTDLEWQFLSAEGSVTARFPKYGFAPRQFADEADLLAAMTGYWTEGYPDREIRFYDAGMEEYAGAEYCQVGITDGEGVDYGACFSVAPDLSRCWSIGKGAGEHSLLARLLTGEELQEYQQAGLPV